MDDWEWNSDSYVFWMIVVFVVWFALVLWCTVRIRMKNHGRMITTAIRPSGNFITFSSMEFGSFLYICLNSNMWIVISFKQNVLSLAQKKDIEVELDSVRKQLWRSSNRKTHKNTLSRSESVQNREKVIHWIHSDLNFTIQRWLQIMNFSAAMNRFL